MVVKENRSAPLLTLAHGERAHHGTSERFVGRERELALLAHALESAVAGHGRMFLISGEPGIGKTRLAEEFSVRAHTRGLRVMWGRSWEGAGAPAYWPIVQIIRACAELPDFAQLTETLGAGIEQLAALVPEIVRPAPAHGERGGAERLDPEQARFRLFDAVATLLKGVAQREPLVIVIDDLHDADLGALQMVRFIARALKDSPVVLLGTHREAEVERSPELRALFAELVRESEQLPLRGLSQNDAADLVRGRTGVVPDGGFVATLHQTTGGNPLFLGGVVQMLVAEGKLENLASVTAADLKLPTNVRSAIAHQLSRLSTRTNSVLAIASALGIEFELAPLGRVAERSAAEILDALNEAASTGIVTSDEELPGRWRFSHALIRAAICEEPPPSARAQLHLRIAEALENIHAADLRPYLAEIAYHFREARNAGGEEKAIDYSIKAADAALALFAFEDAASQFQLALEMMEQHGVSAERRAKLLERAADPIGMARGDKRVAIECRKRALELYEGLGQAEACARAHIALGFSLSARPLANIAQALEHYRKAEAILGDRADTIESAMMYFGMSMTTDKQFRLKESLSFARRAMEIGQRLGIEVMEIHGAAEYAAHLFDCGRLAEGIALADESWKRADALDAPTAAATTARISSLLYEQSFDPLPNQRVMQAELSRTRMAHNPREREDLKCRLCRAHLMAGQLDEATRMHAPSWIVSTAGIALYRGDWKLAEEIYSQEVAEQRVEGNRFFASYYQHHLAEAGWLLGRRSHAIKLMIEALPPEGEITYQPLEMKLRPDLAYFHTVMGDFDKAAAQLARIRTIVAAGENWRGIYASIARAEGAFAAAEGRSMDAAVHFETSIAVSQQYSLPWKEADAFFDWGNALVEIHDFAGAEEKFDAAIEVYHRIEAGQPWIDRVIAERARAVSAAKVTPERAPDRKVFREQGDYWAISFDGAEFNLRDTKGLHYLAHLLRNPDEQVSAIDLAALESASDSAKPQRTVDLGDAGEVLDAKARNEYRRRLEELREEIARTRRMNDVGAAERAEAEYEELTEHLSAAAGLGGRIRRTGSHRERARVAVTRSIRSSIESIRLSSPSMSRHLTSSIRTGHFCRYSPALPTVWQF